jgi:hypothetical protein
MNARLYLVSTNAFPSTNYYSFEFWINGNGYSGQQIGINMLFDDGDTSLQVKINDVLDQGVQQWTWSRVVIPFTLFGLSSSIHLHLALRYNSSLIPPDISRNVRGFVLASISESFGGKIAIDHVMLSYQYPMCTNATKSMYDDGLAKGYSDNMSWGVWNIKSTDYAHTGSYSIE